MIESQDSYPRTERYRKHRKDIQEYGREMAEATLYNEGVENWKDGLFFKMFAIAEKDAVSITDMERKDIYNFVRYATPRFVASMATSDLYQHHIEKYGAYDLLSKVIKPNQDDDNTFAHDLIHVMAADIQSGGISHTPAFQAEKGTGYEADLSPRANQEELIVFLWDRSLPFATDILASEDPLAYVEGYLPEAEELSSQRQVFEKQLDRIRSLPRDRIEYRVTLYEAIYLAFAKSHLDADQLETLWESMRTNRDPMLVDIFTRLFENQRSQEPNPKILLDEFRRLLHPLLARLSGFPEF